MFKSLKENGKMDLLQPLMRQLPPEARAWVALAMLVVLILLVVWGYILRGRQSL